MEGTRALVLEYEPGAARRVRNSEPSLVSEGVRIEPRDLLDPPKQPTEHAPRA
jgi:hypothetical protein